MPPPPGHSRDDRPFDPAELSRVFTVQLRESASNGRGLSGRLTHAATGVAAHFDSAEELVALLLTECDRLRHAGGDTPASST